MKDAIVCNQKWQWYVQLWLYSRKMQEALGDFPATKNNPIFEQASLGAIQGFIRNLNRFAELSQSSSLVSISSSMVLYIYCPEILLKSEQARWPCSFFGPAGRGQLKFHDHRIKRGNSGACRRIKKWVRKIVI